MALQDSNAVSESHRLLDAVQRASPLSPHRLHHVWPTQWCLQAQEAQCQCIGIVSLFANDLFCLYFGSNGYACTHNRDPRIVRGA
jgi:hypothetical protein